MSRKFSLLFFFQAEDGIRDHCVTGVQTCALPIFLSLANFGNGGKAEAVVPKIHQEELAGIVGTTRARISFFMNRFRKLGFVAYKGQSSITIRTAKLSGFVMA